MAPKDQGTTWRFCVNFKPLNQMMESDSYPMPDVDYILSMLGEAKWFSKLDL